MDDYSFGIAMGQKKRAEGAEQGLDSALAACENYKARIRELELKLAVKMAHVDGLTAQLDGFIAAHPKSPVRADSGKRYKDGDIKSVGRILYEAAFDKFAKAAGIANPARHRAD